MGKVSEDSKPTLNSSPVQSSQAFTWMGLWLMQGSNVAIEKYHPFRQLHMYLGGIRLRPTCVMLFIYNALLLEPEQPINAVKIWCTCGSYTSEGSDIVRVIIFATWLLFLFNQLGRIVCTRFLWFSRLLHMAQEILQSMNNGRFEMNTPLAATSSWTGFFLKRTRARVT